MFNTAGQKWLVFQMLTCAILFVLLVMGLLPVLLYFLAIPVLLLTGRTMIVEPEWSFAIPADWARIFVGSNAITDLASAVTGLLAMAAFGALVAAAITLLLCSLDVLHEICVNGSHKDVESWWNFFLMTSAAVLAGSMVHSSIFHEYANATELVRHTYVTAALSLPFDVAYMAAATAIFLAIRAFKRRQMRTSEPA